MSKSENANRFHGWVAEFDSPQQLLAAAERVRDAGYTHTDAFTPFPVHGIDEALGIRPTHLPWIVLGCGLTGGLTGLVLSWWTNAIDYPYIISGKPYWSLPANIPVMFELTILFSAFGALFGMLALNRLPKYSNPLFTNPKFDRATDDTFFLYIDRTDPRFDAQGVQRLLTDLGPKSVEEVLEDDSPAEVPRFLMFLGLLGALVALVPPLIIMQMRLTKSDQPRFHIFHDMDNMANKQTQTTSTLFADGRAMRADVPGTVKLGQLEDGLDYSTGIDMERLAAMQAQAGQQLTSLLVQEPAAADAAGATQPAAADPAAAVDTTPWLPRVPVSVDAALLERGETKFNIYCAVCHGVDGSGMGLVNQRAQQILASTWQQPSSLHQEYLYEMPDGKIFNTITNGIRKMPGYGSQIGLDDRWAIVAYVRALQRSRSAALTDVPETERDEIREGVAPAGAVAAPASFGNPAQN
jgi:mono/diheme cytochrome c family protein